MSQNLLLDFEDEKVDAKLLTKDPETALKILIAQQSNGYHAQENIHSIVKLVMGKDDNNKLKRLFYYFLETTNKEDQSFFICINQIKRDLVSPNEYVRGIALRFASTLQNYNFTEPLLREIKENLANKCAYVRMAAVFCLAELGIRFDLEIEDDILNTIKKESTPQVLTVGFDAMHRLAMSFDEFLKIEYPKEVLEILVEKNEDVSFLNQMADPKFGSVSFLASCKLLSKDAYNEPAIENIIGILERSPELKQDFIPYLKFVATHSLELLSLIDTYELDFSAQVINTVFKNADTTEFVKIAEYLHQRYIETASNSEKKILFKVLLLEKITVFTSTHCVFVDDLIQACLKTLSSEESEIIYASLGFLNVCVEKNRQGNAIHEFLIEKFSCLKFGKIIRRVFDVLSQSISQTNYEKLLDKLLSDLSLCESESGTTVPFYLSKETEVFVGAHISLCLAEAYRTEWNMKSKVIGTLMKIIEVGEMQGILDASSKLTVTACIRSLLDNKKQDRVKEEHKIDFTPVDVLKPIEFSLLKTPIVFKKFHWNDPVNTDQTTIQLSGLGDPLYIEANCTHSRYEIVLDLLIINQTSSYLQDISLDFNFSKNIQMIFPADVFSLQPNTATTVKMQFSIQDTLDSFVTAIATFKYPKKDDYSGKPFVQNLADIVLEINRFLEPADIDFKEQWKSLEWENLYSISMNMEQSGLLQKIIQEVNGHLCDKLETYGFIVGNIACYTLQKTPVLINVCIGTGKNLLVEIRVRSKNDEIVKGVSKLLSKLLKSCQ